MTLRSAILFAAAWLLLPGCASTPEDEKRHAAEREADEQRHEAEERRHAEEDLRRKFARYSTAELKLMDARYKQLLGPASGRDLNVAVNRGWLGPKANSDAETVERLVEIERELLRRWKAGDSDAYLPEFGSVTPSPPSPTPSTPHTTPPP